MKRRVVITGLGAVSPIGNGINEVWKSVENGNCGIGEITQIDTQNHRVKIAGEVKNLNIKNYLDAKSAKRMDRVTQLGLIAAKEAYADSGLGDCVINSERAGVMVSSGIGGLGTIEREYLNGQKKGFDRISPFFIPMSISNITAGTIAIEVGFKGICTCVVTACAGGTNAIGDAFRSIRDGYHEIILTGGTEASITDMGIGGFTSMKALSESNDPNRGSIPFDKERSGFVMGEGAGILILEEYEHAKARNAKIYAEVVGYGATCDAYHMTAPDPEGCGAARCMTLAIKDAGIKPEDVDYINAHGTSTPLNDAGETKAIKMSFGDHAYQLKVSSTKSMTGHLLGGSGGIEGVITALAIKNEFIPPTVNYRVADEVCDLDIVPNNGRKQIINYAISNSLGFGGHNATIVLKRYGE